ncbi:GlsB/YeaQ/YmgE family stress response membrane protein [Streptomyces sp. NPDC012461]|uniref:GlsB/YeaQ/YmgE family stress response membrane protein n=2 Tax=unclassified Streptomyces TaxID=2593676 RepID=A0A6G3R0K2_9ACTN|nr:GlsB/YeaQ/YmgE family stress response membrane protein [Streptomyces sp. H28]MBM7091477.1 GlsB/YeaQ/YmgE family stress response membrane protein [Streptomyces sp. S12]NEA89269.1 GlsB/YeaQ/YmgE family stress response membrane protein [Streptomyces sp. SID14436]NEC26951.1 GlsB/YeaQ/YmgE family stress response membrane protein [Streptomyces sp. SID8111]NEC80384.1 GlsB/YeaQ/YmgE family stress response membrane protein [Streptomyces sp. SID7958]NED19027.1 GlsB/YeaQ/YmgE family stress response me
MSFLWAIIAGLIIGLLAKLVVPGRQPIPLWLTVILGIIGAVAGNGLASAFGVRDTGGIDWIRHIFQIGIAAVLIALITPMWARRRA